MLPLAHSSVTCTTMCKVLSRHYKNNEENKVQRVDIPGSGLAGPKNPYFVLLLIYY